MEAPQQPDIHPQPVGAVDDFKGIVQETLTVFRRHWRMLVSGFALFALAGILLMRVQLLAMLVLPHLLVGYQIMQLKALRGGQPTQRNMLLPFSMYLPILMASLLRSVISMPVEVPMQLGFWTYLIPMLDSEKAGLKELSDFINQLGLYEYSGSFAFNAVIAGCTGAWLFIALSLSQIFYLLADMVMAGGWDRMRRSATQEALETLRYSFRLMKAQRTRFFLYSVFFILIGVSGFALFFVGFMFTAPIAMLGLAVFYNRLIGGAPVPEAMKSPPVAQPPSEV